MSRPEPDNERPSLAPPPHHQGPASQSKWVRPSVSLGAAPRLPSHAASTNDLRGAYKPNWRSEYRPNPDVAPEDDIPYDAEEARRYREMNNRSRLGHHAYYQSMTNLGARVGDQVVDMGGAKPMELRRGPPLVEEKQGRVASLVSKAKKLFGKKK